MSTLLGTPMVDQPAPCVSKLIMPGEHYVSWAPAEINTLLGSCVSACVWDSRHQIGGMNHIMLPDVPTSAKGLGEQTKSLRYGLYAMERLINDLLMMGARRETLRAKVFGGANISGALTAQHVGKRNVDFVLEFLRKDKIKLLATDVGGTQSRRIRFNTQTNAVRVERAVSVNSLALAQEQRYSKKINSDPVNGDIVFF